MYNIVFVCKKKIGVPALAGTCLWRPLTLVRVLNLEAHVTSFKMNELYFKLFGVDFFLIWKKSLDRLKRPNVQYNDWPLPDIILFKEHLNASKPSN